MTLTKVTWGFTDCSVCPEMVKLESANFYMGSSDLVESSTSKNSDLQDNEKPRHLVNIQAFALGKFEVTQFEWHAVMGSDSSLNKGSAQPVENISWNDAQTYIKKFSQKTGKKYRLPSEAEWEYELAPGKWIP